MTSSNGNIFRVTDHLCGEFNGPRWIPRTKASDAELWFFFCVWINGWVNNREAGDLRRYRAHYDVTVMKQSNWSTANPCTYFPGYIVRNSTVYCSPNTKHYIYISVYMYICNIHNAICTSEFLKSNTTHEQTIYSHVTAPRYIIRNWNFEVNPPTTPWAPIQYKDVILPV